LITINGDKIPITGWYSYSCHIDVADPKCFVTMQSSRMFFKKGETAPGLGSCDHRIAWKFIEEYKK
jgi:hypothetical protein